MTSARTASAPDSFFSASLDQADPEIAAAIKGELGRQRHEVELIAPRVSEGMSLHYHHVPKAIEAEQWARGASLPDQRRRIKIEEGL